MAKFQMWKVECNKCSKTAEYMCWDDQIPSKCSCGGRNYEPGTNRPIGLTQRERILLELGELDV